MAKTLAKQPKTSKTVDPDWQRINAEVKAKVNTLALLKELENLPGDWQELLDQMWQRFVWLLDDVQQAYIKCKGLPASTLHSFTVELYERLDAFKGAIYKAAEAMRNLAKSQPVAREAFAEAYAPVEKAASDLAVWRDKLSTAGVSATKLRRVRKAQRGRKQG